MIFEDKYKAAEELAKVYDFMEWTWVDTEGLTFRPRRLDLLNMMKDMEVALKKAQPRHAFINAHGLRIDLTEKGTMLYRLDPEREHVYRLSSAREHGAPLFAFM